jgi:hypothetical protein
MVHSEFLPFFENFPADFLGRRGLSCQLSRCFGHSYQQHHESWLLESLCSLSETSLPSSMLYGVVGRSRRMSRFLFLSYVQLHGLVPFELLMISQSSTMEMDSAVEPQYLGMILTSILMILEF